MQYIADLHIHSKYSRSVSKQMDLEHIAFGAKQKGIDLIATTDYTHPAWYKEIEQKLIPQANGFLQLRDNPEINFVLSTELSCIYRKNDKYRRVHLVVICSSLAKVKKVNQYLDQKGYNLHSDGRPILGLDAKELAKIYLDADDQALIIPAHIWTPWFSVFGSRSGFDSLKECFEDITPEVSAIETGLSSDPAMNWRISELNQRMILSNSDAHSMDKLGREANVFQFKELTYRNLYQAIKQNKNLDYTLEFYPEEGKYHYDGHRACGVRLTPKETKKYKGICPKCGKPLTVGVLNRVEELADQPASVKQRVPYKSLVPLKEIIAEALDQGVNTKGVAAEYANLIAKGKNEFNILLKLNIAELKTLTLPLIAEGIKRVRAGKLIIDPGYDGEFGKVKIFTPKERGIKQQKLF